MSFFRTIHMTVEPVFGDCHCWCRRGWMLVIAMRSNPAHCDVLWDSTMVCQSCECLGVDSAKLASVAAWAYKIGQDYNLEWQQITNNTT